MAKKSLSKKISKTLSWCRQRFSAFKKWYKGFYINRPWYVKTMAAVATLMVSFMLYLGAVDMNFLWLFGKSPGFFQISNPVTSDASEIYSADGVLIGRYYNENRTPVKHSDVNPAFWRALIDTEDERFYKHFGIDPIGLFAVVKDMIFGGDARGASTITQQLAKNMFRVRTQYSTGILGNIPGIRMLIMKSKEWIIAVKLECLYSKDEILTMYANTVDFGANSFGIKIACKTYFNTTPQKMTLEQAATLVGMLKATTTYNPISHPENSIARRNVVLDNMMRLGDITKEQKDSISKIPMKLDVKVDNPYDGQATYFREAVAKHLKEWCEYNGYDLYTSGLKIYTTIDTRMQKYAEEAAFKQMRQVQRNFDNHWQGAEPWRDENQQVIPGFIENIAMKLPVYESLKKKFPNSPDSITHYLNKPHKVRLFDYEKGSIEKEMSTMDSIRYMVSFMHCGFVAMEPQNGHVKAWVGDIDFASWKYDKVEAMRQPGSTFKLFVYTEAMNQGLTPCDKRRDEYIRMEVYDKKKHETTIWTPHNSDGRFTGDSIPLKSAFARSINTIAVRLGQEMGIKNIIATAERMGIKSPLDDQPSLALGSSDVNLLEMANAYSTIANNGTHIEPVLVTRIIDRNGEEVFLAPSDGEEAVSKKTAGLVQQLLMGGMREPGGTSMSLWQYVGKFTDTDFGGKTGTSNNHSDAWFMGVSPRLVVGAWVGGEYRSIHFRTGALGQGSRTALPICGLFLEKVLADPAFKRYRAHFPSPSSLGITQDMYYCGGWTPARQETNDSIYDEDGETEYDENGYPILPPNNKEPDDNTKESENEVILDNL
ncbi:transglycosylase domain-containing protein [Prevotella koreensis]|uniref:transglycosylase domain-containing protein n=1 Tax=Prevotella koreensis TaxID=2490854 RepID=UPI0028EF95F6|nr:transglycosylase domain-containing protein [Prevotella koreensis]